MHAIILAAGRGSRLSKENPQGLPKCLMQFGGKTLLSRHLAVLFNLGIHQVDLVIGFEADQIIDHVGKLKSRPDVAFHFNPRYEQGSVISLWAARDALESGSDILLMDADVLYHPDIMKRLIESRHSNCFLLDRDFSEGDEPVKIAVLDGRMVEFRKSLPADLKSDFLAESVGFFRFDSTWSKWMSEECARFDREGLADAPHEEILRNMVLSQPDSFGFEEITGLPWIEIDLPEDFISAGEQILPAIRQDIPEF